MSKVGWPRIYLAGGFYGEYKKAVYDRLNTAFDLIDPEQIPGHGYPGEYVGCDFLLIRDSRLVLSYQDEYPYVYGMAAEMGYAVGVGVPVIYVCRAKRVDSFLSGLARATFTDVEAACNFIKERYSE